MIPIYQNLPSLSLVLTQSGGFCSVRLPSQNEAGRQKFSARGRTRRFRRDLSLVFLLVVVFLVSVQSNLTSLIGCLFECIAVAPHVGRQIEWRGKWIPQGIALKCGILKHKMQYFVAFALMLTDVGYKHRCDVLDYRSIRVSSCSAYWKSRLVL